MMKMLRITLSVALLIALLGSFAGCGGDDDPNEPPAENCSITVTSPAAGSSFLPGDPLHETVNIRWDETGSAQTVAMDLLKAGTVVGPIENGIANDGFYQWTASNLGASNGSDFFDPRDG